VRRPGRAAAFRREVGDPAKDSRPPSRLVSGPWVLTPIRRRLTTCFADSTSA
jgi:hypothetical protein